LSSIVHIQGIKPSIIIFITKFLGNGISTYGKNEINDFNVKLNNKYPIGESVPTI